MGTNVRLLSVLAFVSMMGATIVGSHAAVKSHDDAVPLIERMTRTRKPTPSTPSTPHKKSKSTYVPVRRVPISQVRVGVDSQRLQPTVPTPQTQTQRQPRTPSTRTDAPNGMIAPPGQQNSPAAKQPTTRADVQFDPIHGEHTLILPDTANDGFVGVPRSRQNWNSFGGTGQTMGPAGQPFQQPYYHSQQAPAMQPRLFPNMRRRFR